MPNISKRKKSWTLIELIIVVVVLGTLVGIAMPNYHRMKEATLLKEAVANIKLISSAELIYSMEDGNFFEESDLTALNEALHLAIAGNNWQYTTQELAGGIVRVTAVRANSVGTFSDCTYSLDSNDPTGEPIKVWGNCP